MVSLLFCYLYKGRSKYFEVLRSSIQQGAASELDFRCENISAILMIIVGKLVKIKVLYTLVRTVTADTDDETCFVCATKDDAACRRFPRYLFISREISSRYRSISLWPADRRLTR